MSLKSDMKIYAPNLHLFAFELYKAANLDATSLPADKIQLWQVADEIVRATLHQDLHLSGHLEIPKESDSPRVDLLKESEVKDGDYSLPFAGKLSLSDTQQVVIKGFAYPLRLHDSYGLWLNLRRPENEDDGKQTEDVDITFLSHLKPNNCFTLKNSPDFLGQTLLITAWLTGAKDKKSVHQIAQECLQAVFPNESQRPPFNRQGELFGSPIFEYGLFSQLANYQHVLIWLFRDKNADESFSLCYQELLDLLFFRTKIIKAYQDSRKTYESMASAYQDIENVLNKLPQKGEQQKQRLRRLDGTSGNLTIVNNPQALLKREELRTDELEALKNQLKELPQLSLKYTQLIRDLEDYHNTIAINEYNYSERLEQINGIIQTPDLQFLKTFSEENSPFFQKQIQADLGYFRHGSTLLEQAIASIRGIVEIEQAERDRSLEKTIQIIGVGLGAGAIVSGVVTQHIDKPFAPISFNNPPHPLVLSLFWSVLATLCFGSLAWLWTKRK